MIGMVAAAILDTATTYYGLSRLPTTEANPVLSPLLKSSFVWLPVYCLVRPLLVPMLPDVARRTFGLFFLVAHLYGGINNSLVIFVRHFSLVDVFGYWGPLILCYVGIAGFFAWQLVRRPKDRWFQFGWSAVALAAFALIEGVFYLLGRVAW